MDFIAIDFEIANNDLSSACSLGIVFVEGNRIVDEKYYLIQPPTLVMDDRMSKVHGLTIEDVKDAYRFNDIWNEIQHYFHDSLVIAHNAQFDMSVLKSCLVEYSLEIPKFHYTCSIPISSHACRDMGISGSLKARTKWFGIQLDHHHNALSDARACAELVIKCVELKEKESIHYYLEMHGESIPVRLFSELRHQTTFYKRKPQKKFTKIDIHEITPSNKEFDDQHPFFEQQIVFTGDLLSIDRKEAMQKVANVGGIIKSGVSRKTNYLVVGKQDKSLVGSSGVSTKEVKANELIEKGFPINIINESAFLSLLKK